jgi:flagellar motor protein MotB
MASSSQDPDDTERTQERKDLPWVAGSAVPTGASDLLKNASRPDVGLSQEDIETREVSVAPELIALAAQAHEEAIEELEITASMMESCQVGDPDTTAKYMSPVPPVPQAYVQHHGASSVAVGGPVVLSVSTGTSMSTSTSTRGESPSGGRGFAVAVLFGLAMMLVGTFVGGGLVYLALRDDVARDGLAPAPSSAPWPATEVRQPALPAAPLPIAVPAPSVPPPSPAPPAAAVPAPPPVPSPSPEPSLALVPQPSQAATEPAGTPARTVVPVSFAPGSDRPMDVDRAGMERVAGVVIAARHARFELVGFSTVEDGVGAEEALELGRARAEAVLELLRALGPSRRRFSMRAARPGEQRSADTSGPRYLVELGSLE